jgi:hypothetical protein
MSQLKNSIGKLVCDYTILSIIPIVRVSVQSQNHCSPVMPVFVKGGKLELITIKQDTVPEL